MRLRAKDWGVMILHPRAQALLFDIDGTLVDTMPLHFLAWMDAAGKHGFPFDERTFYELAGMPAVQILELLAERHSVAIDVAAAAVEKDAAFLRRIEQAQPIPEVVAVVRQYHGRYPMALGTGGTREVAWKTITAAGLAPYFEVLVSSEDVAHHKPAPDTFLECARRLGVPPEVCQVFEDGDLGLEAAVRAGMIPFDIRSLLQRQGGLKSDACT